MSIYILSIISDTPYTVRFLIGTAQKTRYLLGCGGSAQIGWLASGCEALGFYRQVSRTEVDAYGEKIEDIDRVTVT